MNVRTITIFVLLSCMTAPAMAADHELSGTSWRLVEIRSMDDSVYTPEEGASYSLTLGDDGRAAIEAGCNRGSGPWTSEQDGKLTFGPIAATLAACSPDSISERFMAQFAWVRSYVLEDGNLYLATMADGSIIEFAPAGREAAVALVYGEALEVTDPALVQDAILTALFDRYAADNGLEATPAEVGAYVENMKKGMREMGLDAEDDLTPDEKAEVAAMRRDMGNALIRNWKINKSLYEQYGGRIAYQQMGPEPIDAYREFLEEREKAGDFSINDADVRESFWRYFSDESKHDFMPAGSEDEANAFASPPWE